MSGVFGAGVVTELEAADVYDKIEAIYACSAGAFNAAYFLARDSELGSSIYWEDLTYGRFVNFKRILQRKPNGVDINYLMDVSQTTKRLNVEAIQKQPIPFFVKLLNNETGEVKYHNGKEETYSKLKSATSIFPFYWNNGQSFIDAGIREPIGLEYLIKQHPESRIVVVINHQPRLTVAYVLDSYVSGIIAQMMRTDLPFFRYFREKVVSYKRDVEKALWDERVCLIYPPRENQTRPFTTNREKLLESHRMGRQEAERILMLVRNF